jgi:hypothetical protein
VEKIDVEPGAIRLIESLRSLGYSCSTAVSDLIDNSLSAGAAEIRIAIDAQRGDRPPFVLIADDGRGMDFKGLKEAMRFGAYQEYSLSDLGKFGLGLKTASLSQCRKLTVCSRPKEKSNRHILRWDLDHVHDTDKWQVLAPTQTDLEEWERDLLDHPVMEGHGTSVLWSDMKEALPLLYHADKDERADALERLLDEVSEHVRMVFHRYMQGLVKGRKKVEIYLNNQKLLPWDPFCLEEATKKLKLRKFSVTARVNPKNGKPVDSEVIVTPFVLPHQKEFATPNAHKEAAGPRGWNAQQGFYFYRNNRMIQSGGWSNFRAPDEHLKLLRIAVDFDASFDLAFEINITKMRSRIPSEMREELKQAVSAEMRPEAEARYRKNESGGGRGGKKQAKPSPTNRSTAMSMGSVALSLSNAPNESLTVAKGGKGGQVKIIVPVGHKYSNVFDNSLGQGTELKKVAMTMYFLLESIYEEKLFPEQIPLDSISRSLKKLL